MNKRNWDTVALGEIATLERTVVQPQEIKSGTTYVGLEHIDSNGKFINIGTVESGDLASAKFAFDSSHLLYDKLRPYLKKIARPFFEGVCSTDILPILPGSKVNRDFLFHCLRQQQLVDLATARSSGANLPRLSPKILEEFPIPLPPLPEQHRIAAILDKADALREKRRQAIAKLYTLLQSVFLEVFGDPVRNPKGWEVRALSELGALERGKSKHRPRNAPELLGGPYPLIQTGEVANANGYIKTYTQTYSELGLAQSRMWPAGTLCITIAANIAKTAILTFDACFPDSIVGFTPNELATTEFVQQWLSFRQKELEENAPESAQKNINLKILSDLRVPLPPIELQYRFTEAVRKIESIKDTSSKAATKMDELFQALQQRAFSGKLFTNKAVAATQQELFSDIGVGEAQNGRTLLALNNSTNEQ
jgi:type I restriction enzyme S subunit